MRFPFKLKFIINKGMNLHTVFVYGTLKRGEPNHHWLQLKDNGYSKFLGKGRTIKKYPLVIASKYNIPFLLQNPGRGENVIGEMYEIDDQMLFKLDTLEDHPYFYVREIDLIQSIQSTEQTTYETPKEVECWIYFLKQFKPSLMSEPFLVEYHSDGDHAKPYTVHEKRIPGYHAKTDVLLS